MNDTQKLKEAVQALLECARQIGFTSAEDPAWIRKAEKACAEWERLVAEIPTDKRDWQASVNLLESQLLLEQREHLAEILSLEKELRRRAEALVEASKHLESAQAEVSRLREEKRLAAITR